MSVKFKYQDVWECNECHFSFGRYGFPFWWRWFPPRCKQCGCIMVYKGKGGARFVWGGTREEIEEFLRQEQIGFLPEFRLNLSNASDNLKRDLKRLQGREIWVSNPDGTRTRKRIEVEMEELDATEEEGGR